MYLDITEPTLYPVCRRAEFILNLLQGGVIGEMISNELRRIQSFVATEGIVTCMEGLRSLFDSGDFLAAEKQLGAISVRFNRILNLDNIKNRIDAEVAVLSRAEGLRQKVKKSRMSFSRLIRHDKTKGGFQNEIQHLRTKIARFPHSDLAISVGNLLKEIEEILRSY